MALAAGACDMSLGNLAGRASEEWTHTYPLSPGGEVRLVNINGKVEVEGVDGHTVEIVAERIARGATDESARELLPRIKISEDVKPDRVSIETERMGGIMIGAGYEVRYRVKAPRDSVVNVTSTNGVIALANLSGNVTARTTNGTVSGDRMTGGVNARTTNGSVKMDMASVSAQKIALHTTNGARHAVVAGQREGRSRRVVHERWHQLILAREAGDHRQVATSCRRQTEWWRHQHRARDHQRRYPRAPARRQGDADRYRR